jgi:hypothetical protein
MLCIMSWNDSPWHTIIVGITTSTTIVYCEALPTNKLDNTHKVLIVTMLAYLLLIRDATLVITSVRGDIT